MVYSFGVRFIIFGVHSIIFGAYFIIFGAEISILGVHFIILGGLFVRGSLHYFRCSLQYIRCLLHYIRCKLRYDRHQAPKALLRVITPQCNSAISRVFSNLKMAEKTPMASILKRENLRTVPTIVVAHTFCASPDTRISYRRCLLIQGYFLRGLKLSGESRS